jgi:uncharacterized repeat protein (TIGR02059 family)
MASYPIRAAWFGFPLGGTHGGAAVAKPASNAGATVTIPFDEPLRSAPQPTAAQFTATVAGGARAVNAVSVASAPNQHILAVTLASAPTAGQAVVVTYAQGAPGTGRLASASGEEVPSGVIASFNAA